MCVYAIRMSSKCSTIFIDLVVIKAVIDDIECTCLSVLEDWNSNISDHASIFRRHLITFCDDNNNNMVLSSKSHLPNDTFTHYSEAWHTTSWLDHVISTYDADDIIKTITVDYNVSTADHLSVCIDIAIQRVPEFDIIN